MVLGWLSRVANRRFRESSICEVGVAQDCILANFQPSLRDWFVSRIFSQDYVLDYSQNSSAFGAEVSLHTSAEIRHHSVPASR
jgi:hypothetical protein